MRPVNELLLYARRHFARDGGVFFAGGFARQHARFAPICVVARDRNMEYPLMTLFFRLDQAEFFERHHVVLHPLDLLAAHATALDVYSDACKVRRRGFAFFRCSVAVVTAKFLLPFHGPHRGVYLDLAVELFVVGCAQVIEKFACPRTAIAAIGIEPRIKTQRLTSDDRHQLIISFELLQLSIILDARQLQPIDLLILAEQGIARWTKHGVPAQAPSLGPAKRAAANATRWDILMQAQRLAANGQNQK